MDYTRVSDLEDAALLKQLKSAILFCRELAAEPNDDDDQGDNRRQQQEVENRNARSHVESFRVFVVSRFRDPYFLSRKRDSAKRRKTKFIVNFAGKNPPRTLYRLRCIGGPAAVKHWGQMRTGKAFYPVHLPFSRRVGDYSGNRDANWGTMVWCQSTRAARGTHF
jgi:hypothetical protein